MKWKTFYDGIERMYLCARLPFTREEVGLIRAYAKQTEASMHDVLNSCLDEGFESLKQRIGQQELVDSITDN